MGEHRVHVDQWRKPARFSHAQQLSEQCDEGSGAEGICLANGVFGGGGVCEDGELCSGPIELDRILGILRGNPSHLESERA